MTMTVPTLTAPISVLVPWSAGQGTSYALWLRQYSRPEAAHYASIERIITPSVWTNATMGMEASVDGLTWEVLGEFQGNIGNDNVASDTDRRMPFGFARHWSWVRF